MTRSRYGGRHELGQNFLHHRPTIDRIIALTRETRGDILELGAGDGALTRPLALLGRDVLAVERDEHRARRLQRSLRGANVRTADALRIRYDRPVIVSNVPFHLTTPILRRLLAERGWRHAILLTQWEVARKRAGVGGTTMMTAQAAPWFRFELHGRVPSRAFRPAPGVDGGLLAIHRKRDPLVPRQARRDYDRFVRAVFAAHSPSLSRRIELAAGVSRRQADRALLACGIDRRALPRDVPAETWPCLWARLDGSGGVTARSRPRRGGGRSPAHPGGESGRR